jgi:hypothetical protein
MLPDVYLSGHGVKREDDQKYAAQGPPKYSRCLLFSHKSITTELNKRSVRHRRDDVWNRWNCIDYRLSRNEWISLCVSMKDRAGLPRPLRAVAFSTKSQVGVPPAWLFYLNSSHALASREERVADPSCSDDRATGVRLLRCPKRSSLSSRIFVFR